MLHISLFGIPVRIDPSFLFLVGFYAYYAESTPVGMVIVVLAFFVSILVHEGGHALVAMRQGRSQVSITIHGFGGLTHSAGRPTHKQAIVMSLAGPFAGFAFGVLALGLSFTPVGAPGSMPKLMAYLVFLNFFWGVFNLLPIFPMDGGTALGHLLSLRWPSKAWGWTHQVGMVGGGALVVLGLMIGSWFIPLFGALFAYQNWQRLQ
ncbi:MAG: M50 family metallopeptidase [Proteobacteria bacterium]|nr:M50 family metallopeptidase [Pseudomonadota bacterium]